MGERTKDGNGEWEDKYHFVSLSHTEPRFNDMLGHESTRELFRREESH